MPSPDVRLVVGAADAVPPYAEVVAVRTMPGDDGVRLGPDAAALADELGLDLAAHIAREKAKGTAGEVVALPLPPLADTTRPRLVLLAGVGDGSPAALRKSAAAVARRARDVGDLVTTVAVEADAAGIRAVAEALLLATYTFSRKSEPKKQVLRRVDLVHPRPPADALALGVATATAVRRARDLANTPSLEKSPAWLADQAVAMAKKAGLTATVRGGADLEKGGFGGIIAVGAGSARPPRLIELSYLPKGARTHVVLVGKGITFDSGGLSIKPSDGMVPMKTDMGGGAAVIGVMGALGDLGVRARVTALIPAAENMPSGSAQRPGDVITHYGGTTVEVLNTDAEGRLVLADAIAYADAKLNPDVIVDLATLTGAASLGLGRIHGALFASDDRLANGLLAGADAAGERLWRMPLTDDYRDAMDSTVADLRNVGDPEKRYSGGAITAALFLREFAGGRRWAHLDIAGPGRSDKEDGETTKGGTGYGVRLLLRWLESI